MAMNKTKHIMTTFWNPQHHSSPSVVNGLTFQWIMAAPDLLQLKVATASSLNLAMWNHPSYMQTKQWKSQSIRGWNMMSKGDLLIKYN